MCSSYSERQSKSFNLCMIFATSILFLGITVIFLALYNTHNLILSGFAVLVTGLIIVLHTNGRCCKSELTDENRSSSPVTNHPVLNSSRSHQLRQSSNAQLSRQHRNFRRIDTGNTGEVILSCTDWETFGNYSKASETSDKEESCAICFEPLTSRGRLVPCGHASFCYNCSQKIYEQDDSRCPLCRTEIQQVNLETVIFIRK